MKRSLCTLSLVMLTALILAACNMPVIGEAPPTSAPLPSQTELPLVTITQPGVAPTTTLTQAPPSPTVSAPTATFTPLPTNTPTTSPTSAPGACTDKIKFIDDITIPDNTEMLPGQDFVKTWRLQNAGTCTWTNQYSLVFISGDQMNGVSPQPLAGSTAPGATLDVSASMKSPGTVGKYQGNWELQNPSGVKFGTGNNASEPFYVLIKVVEGVSELNLGNPTWTDNMDNAATNWYLLDTSNTKFTQGDGKLVMTQANPGGGDEWGLSNKASMKDYYLQATFITSGSCSGLDKYGLLARAPDPSQGYVLEFSCDGRYRLYVWENNTYTALQEWKAASPIKGGANQTNIMGIWMKGTTLRVYANGYKVAEFTDTNFDHGQFGLVIGAADTNNLTVYVDQVSYWDLSNQ
jgi:hypothetical protein